MSTSVPDLDDLTSWEQAFKYPISTTRQIERQLRNDVAANKERLRTLVGSSYRDLLGTAERIILLDGHIQQAEHLLSEVSLQCSSDVIDKHAVQPAEARRQDGQSKAEGRQMAAQLALLERCQRCLPRMFRRGDSILSAARVIAVSRLLHKSVSQGSASPVLLESTRKRLSSYRQHLLGRIDVVLASPGIDFQLLRDAICAFCVVTSSSSKDAIRHFQALRLDEIKLMSKGPSFGPDSLLNAFNFYLQSLRTSKLLLSRKLSDAFSDLRSCPLLQSPDLLASECLNLASVQQFIPTEILSFVPWVKHQDAGDVETAAFIYKWSRAAFNEWRLSLRGLIKSISNTSQLLKLRRQILQIWLPTSLSTPTHSAWDIFDELRTEFNARMKDLLHEKAASLTDVSLNVESALKHTDTSDLSSLKPIWDADLVRASVGKGAFSYRTQLVDYRLGHTEKIKTILVSVERWTRSMSTAVEEARQVRKVRWMDTIEEDEEDEERAEVIERLLQVDDPSLYEREYTSSLHEALSQFQVRMRNATESFLNKDEDTEAKAVFSIRTIRGIYQQMSVALPEQDLSILSSIIPLLHLWIVLKIASEVLPPNKSYLPLTPAPRTAKNRAKRKIQLAASFHLWGGSPPLPTHPSPSILKLLQRLVTKMTERGADIWSLDGVHALKKAVRSSLVRNQWFKLGEDGSKGTQTVNGDNDKQDQPSDNNSRTDQATDLANSDPERIVAIQNLYDAMYLDYALKVPATEKNGSGHENGNTDKDDDRYDSDDNDADSNLLLTPRQAAKAYIDDSSAPTTLSTLDNRASEYWNRTYLLFGLLSPS